MSENHKPKRVGIYPVGPSTKQTLEEIMVSNGGKLYEGQLVSTEDGKRILLGHGVEANDPEVTVFCSESEVEKALKEQVGGFVIKPQGYDKGDIVLESGFYYLSLEPENKGTLDAESWQKNTLQELLENNKGASFTLSFASANELIAGADKAVSAAGLKTALASDQLAINPASITLDDDHQFLDKTTKDKLQSGELGASGSLLKDGSIITAPTSGVGGEITVDIQGGTSLADIVSTTATWEGGSETVDFIGETRSLKLNITGNAGDIIRVTLTSVDSLGNTYYSGAFDFEITENNPPDLSNILTGLPSEVLQGQEVTGAISGVTDAEGDNVEYSATLNYATLSFSGNNWTLKAGDVDSDKHTTITIYATDSRGASSTYTHSITIKDNLAPNISNMTVTQIPDTLSEKSQFTVTVSGITDPENEAVTYHATSSNNIINPVVSANIVTLSMGETATNISSVINIYVEDASGNRSDIVKDKTITVAPIPVPVPTLNIGNLSIFTEGTTHPDVRITNYDAKYTYQLDKGGADVNSILVDTNLTNDNEITLQFGEVDSDKNITFSIRAVDGNRVSEWKVINIIVKNIPLIEDQSIVFDSSSMDELNLNNGLIINGALYNPSDNTEIATSNPVIQEAWQQDWVALSATTSKLEYLSVLTKEDGAYFIDSPVDVGTKLGVVKNNEIVSEIVTSVDNLRSSVIQNTTTLDSGVQNYPNLVVRELYNGSGTNGHSIKFATPRLVYIYRQYNAELGEFTAYELSVDYVLANKTELFRVSGIFCQDFSFSPDGDKFYTQSIDGNDKFITQYDLSVSHDIRTRTNAFVFNLYKLDATVDQIYQFAVERFSGLSYAHCWGDRGLRLYTAGAIYDHTLRQYKLTKPYDLRTCFWEKSLRLATSSNGVYNMSLKYPLHLGIAINPTGTRLYLLGTQKLVELEIKEDWDITTLSIDLQSTEIAHIDHYITSPSSTDSGARGLQIYNDDSSFITASHTGLVKIFNGMNLKHGSVYFLDTDVDADYIIVDYKNSLSVETHDTNHVTVPILSSNVVDVDSKVLTIEHEYAPFEFNATKELTFKIEISPQASLLSLTSTLLKEA